MLTDLLYSSIHRPLDLHAISMSNSASPTLACSQEDTDFECSGLNSTPNITLSPTNPFSCLGKADQARHLTRPRDSARRRTLKHTPISHQAQTTAETFSVNAQLVGSSNDLHCQRWADSHTTTLVPTSNPTQAGTHISAFAPVGLCHTPESRYAPSHSSERMRQALWLAPLA